MNGAPVIVFGTTAWDAPWLTEHHLADELSRERRVVFVEPPKSIISPLRYGLRREGLDVARRLLRPTRRSGRITVVQPVVVPPITSERARALSLPLIGRQLRRAVASVAQVDGPRPLVLDALGAPDLLGAIGQTGTVYLVKDLNEAGAELIGRNGDALRAEMQEMARRADLVCVTSEKLRATLAERGITSRVLPRGGDAAFIDACDDAPLPAAYEGLPRPLIGYVGRIDGRLDFHALEAVADHFTDGTIVLVGPRSPRLDEAAISGLRARRNVRILPPCSRAELPSYVAQLDAALLPYLESDWSDHASPLKLWDCLGAGIPIAGSGYRELLDFPPPLVRYASPPEVLPVAIEAALAGSEDERDVRRRYARERTWTSSAGQLAGWLDELQTGAPAQNGDGGPHMSVKRALRNRARRLVVDTVPKRHRSRLQSAYRPLVAASYRGSAVECPVCGRSFRRMHDKRSASGRVRPNAQCPRCGSLERHRLMWLFLRDELGLTTADSKLLHIAPEPGIEQRLRENPRLDYLTGDLNAPPAMVAVDICAMQFADESFDAVICNHVLEHVPDDRQAMRELLRVLRPGGWAVLGVPRELERETTLEDPTITTAAERERVYGQFDHVRLYGRDYEQRLVDSGFEVERRLYTEELGDSASARYALMPGDEVMFCRRPAASSS